MKRLTVSLGPAGLAAAAGFLLLYGAGIFLATRAAYQQAPTSVAVVDAPSPVTGSTAGPATAGAGGIVDWKYFQAAPPASGASVSAVPTPPAGEDVVGIARRADAAYAAGDYAAAAADYARALTLAPGNTDLENNLGLVLHYLGRNDDALRHLQAASQRDPGHQRTWLTLGFVRMNTGDRDGAREALARAKELDPQTAVAQKATAYLETL